MNKNILIIVLATILIILLIFLNYIFGNPNKVTQRIPAQCPITLQQCGAGCIPKNADCRDSNGINSYCLRPVGGATGENCYACPRGQAFCGMVGFCYDIGRRCCFGGVCPAGTPIASSPPQEVKEKINATLVSAKNIICAFEKSDLWSPQMPWDGSYICKTSIILNLHGLAFPENRMLKLSINPVPDYTDFSDFKAEADTPIKEITFNYSQVGGDYFQKNKPECPITELKGKLKLFEAIPDIEKPFPTQYFDINIPASCS